MNPHVSTSFSHSVGGNVRNDRVVITTPVPALNSIDGSSNGGIVPVVTNALPNGTLHAPLSTTTDDLVVETPQNQEKPVKIAGSWSQVVKHDKDAAQQPQMGKSFSKMKLQYYLLFLDDKSLGASGAVDDGLEISKLEIYGESLADPEEYPNLFEDWQVALAVESKVAKTRGISLPAEEYVNYANRSNVNLVAAFRNMRPGANATSYDLASGSQPDLDP